MAAPLYLTTDQLSERTGIPAETLRWWRKLGRGPAYQKFGRLVRYPIAAVEAWERSCLVPAST